MNKPSNIFLIIMAWMLALAGLGAEVTPVQAKPTRTPKAGLIASYSPYDVIAAVNAVRAANGLPAYEINSALMAAAQAHSNYQASIGSTTHTGQGGSNVKSRAIAAGYGGGGDVSVIENIFGGGKATPQQAVNWWQGDSLHLNTLLSTRHTDVGAGVAEANGSIYYTLDVGAISGGSVSAPAATSNASAPPASADATQPAVVAFNPVQIAKPGPDGSIVHTVKEGQTLWTIAATYEIAIEELLRLNGLNTGSFIIPGQKIMIKPAGAAETALPTAPPTETLSDTPAALALRPAATRAATIQAITPPQQASPLLKTDPPASRVSPLLVIIAVLVLGGAALMIAGYALNRVDKSPD
jgi:uncharacterized protein YkwD